jgi:hypothetical protein
LEVSTAATGKVRRPWKLVSAACWGATSEDELMDGLSLKMK